MRTPPAVVAKYKESLDRPQGIIKVVRRAAGGEIRLVRAPAAVQIV